MWIGIVVHQFKIFVPEAKNLSHRDLFSYRAAVSAHVAAVSPVPGSGRCGYHRGVNEFTLLKSRHLGHHLQQQGSTRHILKGTPRICQHSSGRAAGSFTLCHIELEEGMTGWKVHVGISATFHELTMMCANRDCALWSLPPGLSDRCVHRCNHHERHW